MTRSGAALAASGLAALVFGAAAAPPRALDTTAPPSFTITPAQRGQPPADGAGPQFSPAPTPNQDAVAPSGPRAGSDPELTPGFFSRKDQYRGEGYSAGSSVQIQQDRRVQPGAGFNLRMPLQ